MSETRRVLGNGTQASVPPQSAGWKMTTQHRTSSTTRTPVQTVALLVGVVFLLVGVLGFVPGVTSHYGEMSFAAHHSQAKLLGFFQVSVLHNLVHLAFGVVGVALSRTASRARTYLLVGGAVYMVLWLYGMLIEGDSAANFVPVNSADNWLHLILGLGMIAAGALLTRDRRTVHATD
ncbi:DUF4383 domain-containing protein [Streptomyces sp. NPDC059944]|uniref:DUF4383 domain-containing protein n=1 Tax=unclassified Streptomyces TaxID=2593676 RepID=UPI0036547625